MQWKSSPCFLVGKGEGKCITLSSLFQKGELSIEQRSTVALSLGDETSKQSI